MGNGAIILEDMLPFILFCPEAREEVGDGAWRVVCDALLVVLMEPSIKLIWGDGLAINSFGSAWGPQLRR